MNKTKSILGRYVRQTVMLLVLAGAMSSAQAGNFGAVLQGQSKTNTTWQAGGLQGWQELELIPTRMY
ncbi:MAG: hypothetical protein DME25_00980, partial [Verrucomicrobia bacterium]